MEGAHSLLERIVCDKDAEPADMPISLLKSITDNFSDDRKIGSGGFAIVYKGLLENEAVIAVKKLSISMCMDENKYNQEVGLLLRMKHKNIVRFLGYCADTQGKMVDHGGKFVMADVRERLLCFEYVPRGTLNEYITDASSGLDWEKRYQIIKGICEGLNYIHKQGVVHLDLKPANILLDDHMVPKIADFGISKCFNQEKSWVTATKLVGTLGYLAPESNALKITSKFDMYSLGVIMMEILTGEKGYSSVDNPGSKTRFNDDEKPPATGAGSPKGLVTIKPVKYAKRNVALTADTVTAMVDINATPSSTVREGLDLVAVLDMSGSMRGERIESLKKAMMFVIMKLTPVDRLSIVTFSTNVNLRTPLRSMTPAAQNDLEALVDGLQAGGWTNIQAGLQTGLDVIAGRVHTNARTPNIFLVSDGLQATADARLVETGQVDIYTFGLGGDADHQLMRDIAKKSPGGTFSSVTDGSMVSLPFSQLLAGLLAVVAQDVQLTLTPKTEEGDVDTIAVAPGTDYKQVTNAATGVVTIKFGTLFAGERRRVVIDLVLKDVSATMNGVYPALLGEAQHRFTSQGRLLRHVPQYIQIKRTWTPSQVPGTSRKSRKVQAEIARRQHADAIKQARLLADHMDLVEARYRLVDAQNALEDIMLEDDVGMTKLVNALRAELCQLIKLMESKKMYDALGRAYALASEASHGRQRYAARGEDEDDVRLFATPRMDAYRKQAKNFEENPTAPVPSVDDDLLEYANS